jgi:gas vesicle protein
MGKSVRVLLGVASLFAAGAIVGMLYAPDKGERTRRRIVRKGRGLYNSVTDTIEESKDALAELQDRLKENLEIVNEEMNKLAKN